MCPSRLGLVVTIGRNLVVGLGRGLGLGLLSHHPEGAQDNIWDIFIATPKPLSSPAREAVGLRLQFIGALLDVGLPLFGMLPPCNAMTRTTLLKFVE